MSDVSQFVSEDSRKPIERLRRYQLWKEADARGIQYPNQAPKTTMIKLLEANGVDVTQPASDIVKWKVINGTDSEGRPNQELYPVTPAHASARNGVNADAVVSQRLAKQKAEEEKRVKEVEKENEDLKSLILKMQERLEALETKGDEESPRKRYWRLYREAKDAGHEVNRKMTLPELESLCGQNAD